MLSQGNIGKDPTQTNTQRPSENKNSVKSCNSQDDSNVVVPLCSLSQLTGFPKEYIKEELMLEKDSVALEDLRALALKFLEQVGA